MARLLEDDGGRCMKIRLALKIGNGYPEKLPRVRQQTWTRAYKRLAQAHLRRGDRRAKGP